MAKVETRNGVLKTSATGGMAWAGWTTETGIEGLTVSPVEMFIADDGTVWALAAPEALPQLGDIELQELRDGEEKRAVLAKLSDQEVAALGLPPKET